MPRFTPENMLARRRCHRALAGWQRRDRESMAASPERTGHAARAEVGDAQPMVDGDRAELCASATGGSFFRYEETVKM